MVAAFLDVEKAFDNVWHNGLRFKIFQLDLPTKMTRWLSDFLVVRLIQINNKKRSHTQLDSRKQVIAFQDRVITINIKEAQHPLK